jgi:hypothetical protein
MSVHIPMRKVGPSLIQTATTIDAFERDLDMNIRKTNRKIYNLLRIIFLKSKSRNERLFNINLQFGD